MYTTTKCVVCAVPCIRCEIFHFRICVLDMFLSQATMHRNGCARVQLCNLDNHVRCRTGSRIYAIRVFLIRSPFVCTAHQNFSTLTQLSTNFSFWNVVRKDGGCFTELLSMMYAAAPARLLRNYVTIAGLGKIWWKTHVFVMCLWNWPHLSIRWHFGQLGVEREIRSRCLTTLWKSKADCQMSTEQALAQPETTMAIRTLLVIICNSMMIFDLEWNSIYLYHCIMMHPMN